MVGRVLFVLILMTSNLSSAQDEYIQPGLLAASITYSPSTMLNHDQNNLYVTGFAEYYLDKKFSFRGDTYFFLNTQSDDPVLHDAASSYFGLAYHMNKGNWDGSIGIQTGVSYMNRTVSNVKSSIQPSAALRIGTSYYVWKYFHFFANLTYTKSKLMAFQRGSLKADELIISAGLGFQIQTRKK